MSNFAGAIQVRYKNIFSALNTRPMQKIVSSDKVL